MGSACNMIICIWKLFFFLSLTCIFFSFSQYLCKIHEISIRVSQGCRYENVVSTGGAKVQLQAGQRAKCVWNVRQIYLELHSLPPRSTQSCSCVNLSSDIWSVCEGISSLTSLPYSSVQFIPYEYFITDKKNPLKSPPLWNKGATSSEKLKGCAFFPILEL